MFSREMLMLKCIVDCNLSNVGYGEGELHIEASSSHEGHSFGDVLDGIGVLAAKDIHPGC